MHARPYFVGYTRSVHTIISPTEPNVLCIQRGTTFRLSQSPPQAFNGRLEDGSVKAETCRPFEYIINQVVLD
jgi:hypothetical protein